MIRALIILSLLLATSASAQFNGCPPGPCNQFAGSLPSSSVMITEDNNKMLTEDGNHMVIE